MTVICTRVKIIAKWNWNNNEQNAGNVSYTELCRKAEVSRITFYAHYSDKYALADDIFNDMVELGTADYRRRQQENNPYNSLVAGYVNVLECILDLYYDRIDFFRHTDPDRNPYLAIRFYTLVLETVEMHTSHIRRKLQLKLGFINESHEEKASLEEIRRESRRLLTDLLRSGVLTEEGV